ncbi:MAG TPA: CsgG/HfaB family protein [Burkholderiales bacterium]|nr:CsgG/HfaB family protein [Burkholderiales bacterium]
MKNRMGVLAAALLALGGGNAWSQSQTAGGQLEKCNETLGTLAVVEDRNAGWYRTMQTYQVQSTVPLLRMLIQQSNCFVVVERGAAMNVMRQERDLERSGETRQGSDFGKGQLVAADYAMNPSITFSSRDTGGIGAAVGGLTSKLGSWGSTVGAVAGSLKFKEASTMLTLIDNRSGVQLAAAEGNSSKTDFGAWGGVFGGGGGGTMGGYTKTPEGKVIASSFADAYNNLVKAARNYKAQEVKGGLGTGGRLGVQGGRTQSSKDLNK